MAPTREDELRLATYNVHGCVGLDRRYDPERIAEVILELDADVVGLQEVEARGRGDDLLALLGRVTHLQPFFGKTFRRRGADYGNALLTRLDVHTLRRHDLSVSGREPRGALDVELSKGGRSLRVVVSHFGLSAPERHSQATDLLEIIRPGEQEHFLAVMADFNEWLPLRRALFLMHEHLGHAPMRRSFPSLFPFLPLDRIWIRPREALREVRAHRSPLARRASDHLPVLARVAWSTASGRSRD